MANTVFNTLKVDQVLHKPLQDENITLYQLANYKTKNQQFQTPIKNSHLRNQTLLQRRSTAPSSKLQPKLNKNSNQRKISQHSAHSLYKKKIGPYIMHKTLGAGSMGKVKLATNETTSQKVAVKIINRKANLSNNSSSVDKTSISSKSIQDDLRVYREVSILGLFNHNNILKLHEFYVSPHHYYIVTEFIDGCQLLDYIVNNGKLKESMARNFGRQIFTGLEYCHKNSVVHRDLKIENILVTKDGKIKLIDFGLSNLYSEKSLLSTFCGSLYFAAPELLFGNKYTGPEVDVWSFGIILYVLICGRVPFDDKNLAILHNKIKYDNVVYSSHMSPDCLSLLKRILMKDPKKRATLQEIGDHTWMNTGYKEKAFNKIVHTGILDLPVDVRAVAKLDGFKLGSFEHVKSEIERQILRIKQKHKMKDAIVSEAKINFLAYPLLSIYRLALEKVKNEAKFYNSSCTFNDSGNSMEFNESKQKTENEPDVSPVNTFEYNLYANRKNSDYVSSIVQSENTTNNAIESKVSRNTDTLNRLSSTSIPKIYKESEIKLAKTVSKKRQTIAPSVIQKDNRNSEQTRSQIPKHTFTMYNKDFKHLDQIKSLNIEDNTKTVTSGKSMLNNIRTIFFKGLFTVSTTSTISVVNMRSKIIVVLEKLKLTWHEENGYLLISTSNVSQSNNEVKLSDKSDIRKKFNFIERFKSKPVKSPATVLEMYIVKIPMLKLHGIKFNRLEGNFWQYKNICSMIIDHLEL